jgi:hypothetical protein
VATALLAAGASSAHATTRRDVSVFALIPAPGYPALVANQALLSLETGEPGASVFVPDRHP